MFFRTSTALTTVAAVGAAGLALAPAVVATPAGDQIVINEVYFNGDGASGPYLNDFIELYNPGDDAIPLDGMRVVVYGGVADKAVGDVELEGELAAGDHFLLKLTNSAKVASDDAIELADADMEDDDLRVPAHNGAVALSFGDATLDLVGYGTTERYEGTAARVAKFGESLARTDAEDTNDNAADFSSGKPTPQHSTATVEDEDDLGELSTQLSSRSSR